jgi:hypothetical protein
MQNADQYGRRYWCVKSPLSQDGEIYLHADFVEVSNNGDLQLVQKRKLPEVRRSRRGRSTQPEDDGNYDDDDDIGYVVMLAIAAGNWTCVFAASVIDGHAVAADHWKGEITDKEKPAV